jgi:6-phosphogluconolactonase
VANLDNLDIAIYSHAQELITNTVNEALASIEISLREKGVFHLALTGGAIGVAISEEIARAVNSESYSGLNIWWSDERFVSLDSKDRNDLVVASIIKPSSGVVVHRVNGSGDIETAARAFQTELERIDFDLNIMGVGPDGHVASLFPGALHEAEIRDAFAITDSPKPPKKRITVSLNKINRSSEIWVVASGDSKREAIEGFMDGDMNLPVSHLNVSRLLVDSAAFGVEAE